MDLLSGSVAADIAKFFEKWQPESEPLCLSRDVPANLRNAGQRMSGETERAARFAALPFRDWPHPHTARPPLFFRLASKSQS
jgi:hypothetical protein